MKTILPWALVVLLGGVLGFGYTVLQQKNSEIAQLTQQLQSLDALKAENESLKLAQADAKELERLRKENQEIYRLRNEVAQLRKPIATSVSGLSGVSNFSGDAQTQIEQLQKENLQLRSEIGEFQTLLARQGKGHDCITNLRIIQGAKERWAEEHSKQQSDIPTDEDLFGAARYVTDRPVCPQGGFYNVNAVGSPPTCSYPGHIMPP